MIRYEVTNHITYSLDLNLSLNTNVLFIHLCMTIFILHPQEIGKYIIHIFGLIWIIPAQRPVSRSFDVFLDMRLNKELSKQSWGWWFGTPSRSLWRHCNVLLPYHFCQLAFKYDMTTKYHILQMNDSSYFTGHTQAWPPYVPVHSLPHMHF